MISRVNPPSLGAPSGFAHAVVVGSAGSTIGSAGSTIGTAGSTIYLAGQTAMNAKGQIVAGGIVAQFRQSLTNVLAALAGAGGSPADLVNVTIYLLDIPDYQANGREIGKVWKELAGTEYPAMAGIGVTALWQPEALVEIQAIAVIGA